MQIYKKDILLGSLIGIFTLLYTLLIYETDLDTSIYVVMLNDYTYVFAFTAVLFLKLYNAMDYTLFLSKLPTIDTFIKWEFLSKLKSYSLIFCTFTTQQSIVFLILDPEFNFITFLYRNVVFFVLINFINYLLIFSKTKHHTRNIVIMYLLWIVFYFISIIFPESIVNIVNVFVLLRSVKIEEILRFIVFLLIPVVYLSYRISNRRRFVSKWLS